MTEIYLLHLVLGICFIGIIGCIINAYIVVTKETRQKYNNDLERIRKIMSDA